jgi:hypothetical protein
MGKNEQLSSIEKTRETLSFLRTKLMIIDSKYEPDIKKLAEEAVAVLPMSIQQEEKPDIVKQLLLETFNPNFETFPVLEIEMSTLLREVRQIGVRSLDMPTVSASKEEDITYHTYAQYVELLKELSFISGYISQLSVVTNHIKEKTPFGKFWHLFLNLLLKKTKNEQQKAFQVSYDLLQKAKKESPQISDITITFRPLLG